MTEPGTVFQSIAATPRTTIPTTTDPWFVTGFTALGIPAVDALIPCHSLDDFIRRFGGRLAYSVLYDSAEAFFAEGGSTLYVARVTGPTPSGDLSTLAGVDDHTNATEAQWTAALALFPRALGPGQVSAPGRSTSAAYTALLDHAAATNRVALLDGVDTPTAATHTAATSALKSYVNANRGSYWAPWAVGPGLTPGTTRSVPWSAIEAGMIARNDSSGNDPDDAVAGDNGISRWAFGLSQPRWDGPTRDTLNQAGVNIARDIFGTIRAYGYRTLVDPTVSTLYLQLTGVRLLMAIQADLNAAAEAFVFKKIDGFGHIFVNYKHAMVDKLIPYYDSGSLYGTTPDEAFQVNTSPAVNTPTTIAAGEIHAAVGVRVSPDAELAYISVAKIPITQSL